MNGYKRKEFVCSHSAIDLSVWQKTLIRFAGNTRILQSSQIRRNQWNAIKCTRIAAAEAATSDIDYQLKKYIYYHRKGYKPCNSFVPSNLFGRKESIV